MILVVVLYFAFATAALAFLLLPGHSARALGWTQRLLRGSAVVRRSIANRRSRAHRLQQMLGARAAQACEGFAPYRPWMPASLALLVAAPLLPLALSGFLELDGYDHRVSHAANPHIAALLQGEQLVTPPALPPEWFTTHEVEHARPLMRGANRQWGLLNAEFRQRLLVVFKLMRQQHGIEMVLLEGYRTPQRQRQLKRLGPQTTGAGAFESGHQYGLAADCAFVRNGRIVISEQDAWAKAAYERYGEVARSVGLVWGGGWRSLQDYGHVELPRAGVMTRPSAAEEPQAAHAH